MAHKTRKKYEFIMKDMHIITATTPIVEVIKRYRYFFYSKHNDIYNELLQDEIPLVEKALQDFVDQLGEIQSSNKIWTAICIGTSHHYIAFRERDTDGWVNYYDLKEIDKRYVDLKIDALLN